MVLAVIEVGHEGQTGNLHRLAVVRDDDVIFHARLDKLVDQSAVEIAQGQQRVAAVGAVTGIRMRAARCRNRSKALAVGHEGSSPPRDARSICGRTRWPGSATARGKCGFRSRRRGAQLADGVLRREHLPLPQIVLGSRVLGRQRVGVQIGNQPGGSVLRLALAQLLVRGAPGRGWPGPNAGYRGTTGGTTRTRACRSGSVAGVCRCNAAE